MAALGFNFDAYSDALVVLGTAGLVVPLARRFGINPVLGWLAAGAVLGPLGLGALIDRAPFLYWVTIVDADSVARLGDLGVVFLLFLIGLELSYERLKTMRRLVFGLGGLQVLLSTLAIAAVLGVTGQTASDAVVIGACLALSSTAIVIEVLADQGRLAGTLGRASFAVLLAQDLAVIPILMFIAILAGGTTGSIMPSLGLALGTAVLDVVAIVIVGRLLFRPLFRLVAGVGQRELFVAATLFVIIGAGVAAAAAGLSMALGAFVAGLLLAETEFRKAIENAIGPFKGLLLGLFFFSIGMTIDPGAVVRAPVALALGVVGLILGKGAILYVLGRLFRLPRVAAVELAMLLGPAGEFAFVGIGLAASLGLIGKGIAGVTLTVTAVTMALIPVLAALAARMRARIEAARPLDPDLAVRPQGATGHAIVIGNGRVGQVVSDLLDRNGVAHVTVDNNPRSVLIERRQGREVYFGDAIDAEFLTQCGLAEARAVIITAALDAAAVEELVQQIRAMRPDVVIVARARDADQARKLYALGVTDAVPETIEASLQLSEAALLGMGLAAGRVIESIHDKRDEFRAVLGGEGQGRRGVRTRAAAGPKV